MNRLCVAIVLAVLALSATAYADDAPHKPQRWMQVIMWKGDEMVMMSEMPLTPGFPVYVDSGTSGPAAPEGMAPLPVKIGDFIKVECADADGNFSAGKGDAAYEDALKYAETFMLSNVRFNVYSTGADRIGVAIFDENLTAPRVQPDPANSFAQEEGSYYKGYLEAWFIGGITPPSAQAFVQHDPMPPSVTLKDS